MVGMHQQTIVTDAGYNQQQVSLHISKFSQKIRGMGIATFLSLPRGCHIHPQEEEEEEGRAEIMIGSSTHSSHEHSPQREGERGPPLSI